MSTFKKLFATLVLVLFVTSVSMAQVNKNYDGVKPEVKKGAHALVFMYSPFVSGSLSPVYAGSYSQFNGATSTTLSSHFGAGYKYFVSDQFALMGGIYFGMVNVNGAADTIKQTITDYGIALDGIYQFKPLYSIAPYIGLQVSYGAHKDETETKNAANTIDKIVYEGNAFGVALGVGFDWYFTEGMSLGGKYTLGFRSYSAPESTFTPGTSGSTSVAITGPDVTRIGIGSASIYLNVHLP